MTLQEKQLGQLRPGVTTPVSVYSPGADTTAIIKNITVCNTTSSKVNFSIYNDDDGTTYDQTTAMYYSVEVEGNASIILTAFIAMNNSAGNLAVQSSTASALTFTVHGAEVA